MQLPPEQVNRFYRIWFPLLYYVNGQRHLVTPFPNDPQEASIPIEDAMKLLNALWADDALRQSFIADNPAGLPHEDLAIVESWQYRLSGKFFVMRYLKKYTVFLSEHPSAHLYGVLGLISLMDEVITAPLPVYIEAVLLPFEDKIIYDGLVAPYNVFFGPGIRGNLNDEYRNLQEREGIITTLMPTEASRDLEEVRKEILARDKKLLTAFRKDLAKRGLSLKMVEQHSGNIGTFGRDYLLPEEPPRGLLDITTRDVQTYLREAGDKTLATSFKRFVRFLADTGRIDYEAAESLREVLKQDIE